MYRESFLFILHHLGVRIVLEKLWFHVFGLYINKQRILYGFFGNFTPCNISREHVCRFQFLGVPTNTDSYTQKLEEEIKGRLLGWIDAKKEGKAKPTKPLHDIDLLIFFFSFSFVRSQDLFTNQWNLQTILTNPL